jgi:hypothetical protein
VVNEHKKFEVYTSAFVSYHICTLEVCLVLQQKNFLADFFLLLFSEVVPHGHVPSKLKNRLPSLKNSMVPWWFFSGPEQVYSSNQLMPT